MKLANKKRLTNLAATAIAAGTVMAGFASSAQAAFMLSVSDGTTTVEVTDNDINDSDFLGAEGLIQFNYAFSGLDLSLTTGSSKPLLGDAFHPALHLDSVRITTNWTQTVFPSTLTISLTDTDFLGPIGPGTLFTTGLGGVTDGTVSLASYYDSTNAEFGTEQLISDLGDQSGGAFAAGDSAYVDTSDPFSLTLVATITHDGLGQDSSFDATVAVPEPSTLALLGLGLLASGFARRRQAR